MLDWDRLQKVHLDRRRTHHHADVPGDPLAAVKFTQVHFLLAKRGRADLRSVLKATQHQMFSQSSPQREKQGVYPLMFLSWEPGRGSSLRSSLSRKHANVPPSCHFCPPPPNTEPRPGAVWALILEEGAPFSFLIRSILFRLRHLPAQQTPTCRLTSSPECFSWAVKSAAEFTEDETL